MTPLLIRLLGFAVVFTLFCGCALTRDRFRPMPTQGQTREQGLKDQEECNDVALANKGSAAQASAMGSPVGVAAGFLLARNRDLRDVHGSPAIRGRRVTEGVC